MMAALARLEVEDMALNHTGIPLDFDFPALLAYAGGLIAVRNNRISSPELPYEQGFRTENSIIQRVLS